jgi:carbonic anhydrase
MSAFDELARRNRAYAESGRLAQLNPIPKTGVLIVTCIDPRVEPARFLGVDQNDALVVRNAGGRVNDGTIFDIALVTSLREAVGAAAVPPMEVAVIHHTQCGSGFLADDDFRHGFAARTGLADAGLQAAAIVDPHVTVRADVQRLRSSPLVADRIVVSGHELDLQTGLVETVLSATSPYSRDEQALD